MTEHEMTICTNCKHHRTRGWCFPEHLCTHPGGAVIDYVTGRPEHWAKRGVPCIAVNDTGECSLFEPEGGE